MTAAEWRLWSFLGNRRLGGFKFKRQFPVGPYILDFACFEMKVAVEIDGSQHANNSYDDKRTDWLEAQGWRVLRYWNNQVLAQTESVISRILETLNSPSPVRPDRTDDLSHGERKI